MLSGFNNNIQKIEGELISTFELIDILRNLIYNLENGKNEHFINSEMEGMINALEEEGCSVKKSLTQIVKYFLICV